MRTVELKLEQMKLVFALGGQQEADECEEAVCDTEMEQYLQGYLYPESLELLILSSCKSSRHIKPTSMSTDSAINKPLLLKKKKKRCH